MKDALDHDAENASGDVTYAYKASFLAAPLEFRLATDALEWRRGALSGRTPYEQIRRVRLGFRPVTMQNYRFLAEIWIDKGPKLQVASTSAKSMVEHERLDVPYRAFVTTLMRRVEAVGATTVLQTGSQPLIYWPGVIILCGVLLGIAILIVRALQTNALSGAAFLAAFLAFFVWQAFIFFGRNKPGTFRADNVPERVLPKT